MAHSQYLTYNEYASLGGMVSQAVYLPLEFKARKRIDYLTDSRVQAMENVPESVKLCTFALVNMDNEVGAEAQAAAPAVTAFGTDGYSESYGNALDANEADAQMNKTVGKYLFGERDDNGVPLLYRGARG